jgi:hypothetical protein
LGGVKIDFAIPPFGSSDNCRSVNPLRARTLPAVTSPFRAFSDEILFGVKPFDGLSLESNLFNTPVTLHQGAQSVTMIAASTRSQTKSNARGVSPHPVRPCDEAYSHDLTIKPLAARSIIAYLLRIRTCSIYFYPARLCQACPDFSAASATRFGQGSVSAIGLGQAAALRFFIWRSGSRL